MLCVSSVGYASDCPVVGDVLPAFTMPPLALDKDAATLGLDSNREFTLADIGTPYVLIEVIG